jgi:hypothetical protein
MRAEKASVGRVPRERRTWLVEAAYRAELDVLKAIHLRS